MSNIHPNDIKVQIKLLNSSTLLAQATVIFFEILETHGWKVLKSNRMHPNFGEEVWIQAPSYKRQKNGKTDWKEIVYITDKKLYEQVSEKIYDSYHMARTKKAGGESIEENKVEEVNPEEVPF